MRVSVDATKCEGYGTCAIHAPEIFKLDEWGYAYADGDGVVTPELREAAQRAIADCPIAAIVVLSDGDA